MAATAVLQEERFSPFVRVTMRIWVKSYRSIIALVSPFFDLLLRLLAGTRNRISVLVNWIWSFFTLQSGIRLITGRDNGA